MAIHEWEVKRIINGILVSAGELAMVTEIVPTGSTASGIDPATGRRIGQKLAGVWGLQIKVSRKIGNRTRVLQAFDQSGIEALAIVREQDILLRPVEAEMPYEAPRPRGRVYR